MIRRRALRRPLFLPARQADFARKTHGRKAGRLQVGRRASRTLGLKKLRTKIYFHFSGLPFWIQVTASPCLTVTSWPSRRTLPTRQVDQKSPPTAREFTNGSNILCLQFIWTLIRAWDLKYPARREKLAEGSVARALLNKKFETPLSSEAVSFETHPGANPVSRSEGLVRFQVSPRSAKSCGGTLFLTGL